MPDIKDMLDNIIDGANNKFPNTVNSTMHQNMGTRQPQTFDAGQFREKLSLYVLHDLISAMMHDDTKDIDGMIDASIMQHIRDDYGCGCYDYLCKCRDNTNSRVLDTVVQEIDDKTEEVTEKVSDTQDDAITNDMENLEKELPGIDSYQKLREKLRKFVSAKVVEDVAKEVKDSTAAPDFSNLDKHVAVEKTDETNTAAEEGDVSGEDVQSESVCMNICHKILAEAAVHRISVTMEQAMELSFIEFCMSEMDALFKMDPMRVCLDRWQKPTPIQEAFWGRIYQEDAKSSAEFLGKVAKKTGEMTGKLLKKTGEVMKAGINGKPSGKDTQKSTEKPPVPAKIEEELAMCRAAKKNYEKYFSAGSKKRPTDEERLEYRALYDCIQTYTHLYGSRRFEDVKLKHPANHASNTLAYTTDLRRALDHWYHNYDAYIAKRKESYSEQLDRELKQNGYREYATESTDDDFFE